MKSELKKILTDLFSSQKYAVLATVHESAPQTHIVAFTAHANLATMIFVTPRKTTKFKNIQANPAVSLFVDSRTNSVSDINNAIGVTVLGKGFERSSGNKSPLIEIYREKYPHLSDFLDSPECAVIELEVNYYIIVQNFQDTITVDMREELSS